MFRNRSLITFFCIFLFVLLSQQSTYIVSSFFAGVISIDYIFGNTAQLALNSVFVSVVIFLVVLTIRYFLEKVSGRPVSHFSIITATMISASAILFAISIRPLSVPLDLDYRGCKVRIAGDLTSCGFWSAASDLLAMLLVSFAVAFIYQKVKRQEP